MQMMTTPLAGSSHSDSTKIILEGKPTCRRHGIRPKIRGFGEIRTKDPKKWRWPKVTPAVYWWHLLLGWSLYTLCQLRAWCCSDQRIPLSNFRATHTTVGLILPPPPSIVNTEHLYSMWPTLGPRRVCTFVQSCSGQKNWSLPTKELNLLEFSWVLNVKSAFVDLLCSTPSAWLGSFEDSELVFSVVKNAESHPIIHAVRSRQAKMPRFLSLRIFFHSFCLLKIHTLSQKQRIFLRNASKCIWEQVPWPVNFQRLFTPPPFRNFREIQGRNKNYIEKIRSTILLV
jgi:hypothetical protein